MIRAGVTAFCAYMRRISWTLREMVGIVCFVFFFFWFFFVYAFPLFVSCLSLLCGVRDSWSHIDLINMSVVRQCETCCAILLELILLCCSTKKKWNGMFLNFAVRLPSSRLFLCFLLSHLIFSLFPIMACSVIFSLFYFRCLFSVTSGHNVTHFTRIKLKISRHRRWGQRRQQQTTTSTSTCSWNPYGLPLHCLVYVCMP